MLPFIKSTTGHIVLGALCIGCVAVFVIFRRAIGGKYLDEVILMDSAELLLHATNKKLHLLLTLVVDTLFPVAYGSLLAGLALKGIENHGLWPAAPAVAAAIADLGENVTHVFALTDKGVPKLKPIMSLTKWFFLALVIITLVLALAI